MQRRFAAAIAAILLATGPPQAQVDVNVMAGVVSHCYWRGSPYGADDKGEETAFAPVALSGITISHDTGLSLNVQGAWFLTDRDIETLGQTTDLNAIWDRIDLGLDYTRDLNEKLGISIGGIYYHCPNAPDPVDFDWADVYAGGSYSLGSVGPGELSMGLRGYYQAWIKESDVDPSWYYTLTADYNLSNDVYVGATIAGGNEAFDAVHHIDITASYSLDFGAVTVTPMAVLGLPVYSDPGPPNSVEYLVGVLVGWSN